MEQGADDNADFEVESGATPTSNTGPDSDHTGGGSSYIYISSDYLVS